MPRLPALQRLLARADREPGPASYPHALFELFGVPVDGPLPTAAACYYADSQGHAESRYLLHADPIYLRPDQDRLLGFDFHHQPLSMQEAQAFGEAFNQHFADEGLKLLVPHPTRWYLAVEQAPRVDFHPLSAIIGRNVDRFLPEGEEAARWRAWMNEIQMLFHSLPANMEREASGRLPVCGLWFSGGGYMPWKVSRGFTEVKLPSLLTADPEAGRAEVDPLQQGLASLADGTGEDYLYVEQALGRAVVDGDPTAWRQALIRLDQRLQGLMGTEFWLYTCDGQAWHWRPHMRWRWWRRAKPIAMPA